MVTWIMRQAISPPLHVYKLRSWTSQSTTQHFTIHLTSHFVFCSQLLTRGAAGPLSSSETSSAVGCRGEGARASVTGDVGITGAENVGTGRAVAHSTDASSRWAEAKVTLLVRTSF
jgi:hypothetical protein